MTDNAMKWAELAARLRKALGLAPPTLKQADAEMAAAGEAPLNEDDIRRIVDAAAGKEVGDDFRLDTDYGWTHEVETGSVSEEMLVLNRNRGDDDPEVQQRIEQLRKKALEDDEVKDDEVKDDEVKDDESGVENS